MPIGRLRLIPLALAITLASCTSGASPTPSGTASSTAAPSPTPTPTSTSSGTTSPSPSLSPSPSATTGPTATSTSFACQALPVTRASTALEVPITDVRVGSHPGYDRIVFEFGTAPLPDILVETAQPPFVLDPSGLPATVAGAAFLRIRLSGVLVDTVSPGQVDQRPGYPVLIELRRLGSYEGVSAWIAGLTSAACARVSTLSGPTRLVIDVAVRP